MSLTEQRVQKPFALGGWPIILLTLLAVVSGLLFGWFIQHPHAAGRRDLVLDMLIPLSICVCAAVQSIELLRVLPGQRRWVPPVAMTAAVLSTLHGTFSMVNFVVDAGLWLALALACAQRRQTLAIASVVACAGYAIIARLVMLGFL